MKILSSQLALKKMELLMAQSFSEMFANCILNDMKHDDVTFL